MAMGYCDYPGCRPVRSVDEYEVRRYMDRIRYELREEMRFELVRAVGNLPTPVRPQQRVLPGPGDNMKSLTVIARKVLDPDLRALIKAGILDDTLNVTDEGTDFLLGHYLSANKKELAREAKEKIKEDKDK